MTDFFKNNPAALRHCIRFEILQGNSIEQAYSNICSVIGNEIIDHKNFELSFNQFSKQKSNNKKKEKPIAEILRNDKYALRVCILYESLKYKSGKLSDTIFEVFVNFCKVIGVEDVLKFSEFEFWFYRFLNGEYELNYERDQDKKIYELMDMPIHVMENIAEYLDIFDRAKLVQTSRSLQTFVKNQKLFIHTLELNSSWNRFTISFDKSVDIQYMKDHVAYKKIYKNRQTLVRGVPYWKQAIRDIRQILKNSNLHLDTLEIELNVHKRRVFNDLKDALKFDHHLNVKNLILGEFSSDLLVKILPKLKPEYLTTINAGNCWNRNVDSTNTVFETEQWKQAKKFKMGNYYIWPWHHLYHFTEFRIGLEGLSVEHIRQMKEILFKSTHFEKCTLSLPREIGVSIFEQEFGYSIRRVPYIYHYPIPNSNDYFVIKVENHGFEHLVKVARKKN